MIVESKSIQRAIILFAFMYKTDEPRLISSHSFSALEVKISKVTNDMG
jgi:hypothetical protein